MSTARIAIVVLFAASTSARAEPDAARAEALFRQGRDLMVAGKLEEACRAFEDSQHAAPAITTLLNLAACREQSGHLATALVLFTDAERETRAASDDVGRQLHEAALDHARQLEGRMSKLTIQVPSAAAVEKVEILRDGRAFESALWTSPLTKERWGQPVLVDGGTYTIVVHARGRADWSTTVEVAPEGDAKIVDVPSPADAAIAKSPAAPIRAEHHSKALPIGLAAGSLVLAGGALAFNHWGDNSYKRYTSDPSNNAAYDRANLDRHVAIGLGVAGAACAGVAIWLYVRARVREPDTSARLEPIVGPDRAGIALTGSYR